MLVASVLLISNMTILSCCKWNTKDHLKFSLTALAQFAYSARWPCPPQRVQSEEHNRPQAVCSGPVQGPRPPGRHTAEGDPYRIPAGNNGAERPIVMWLLRGENFAVLGGEERGRIRAGCGRASSE